MRLVVGLGNPGEEYRETRHNLGFRAAELLADRLSLSAFGELCRATVRRSDHLAVALPQTFMNRSGASVRCLVELLGVTPEEDLLIVYDEVQLPLGKLRLRGAGGPGGHRGMESIVESLQTERLARLRLGIGSPPGGGDLAEYVLAPIPAEEAAAVGSMLDRAVDALARWVAGDFEGAARSAHAPDLPDQGELT